MTREELEMKTKAELVEHAEALGVNVAAADSKGTMIDKIMGDYKAPVEVKDKPLPPLGALYTLDGKRVAGKQYRVTIFDTETDKSDVPIVVNGHNIKVKRGVEVIMHEAYLDVLRNAIVNTVVQDPDTGVKTPRTMLVFPHQAIEVAVVDGDV